MRRPDKAGGKAITTRRKTLKRRSAPKASGRRSSLAGGKETNVAQLIRERDGALEQQAATSECPQDHLQLTRRACAAVLRRNIGERNPDPRGQVRSPVSVARGMDFEPLQCTVYRQR